ncbi:MAG: RDD family protein [Pyrinomonadaceae bacterium]
MNDTVREELEAKITSGRLRSTPPAVEAKPLEMKFVDEPAPVKKEPIVRESAIPVSAPPPVKKRIETADLTPPKTSPTLVGFQSQKATLPDWRLQIQNAVQQRVGGAATATATAPAATTSAPPAVKPQAVQTVAATLKIPEGSDPRVAAAMKRIDESRKAFLPKTPAERMAAIKPASAAEARPFQVVPKPFTPVGRSTNFAAPKPTPPAKPMIAVTPTAPPVVAAPSAKVDTNKLPKLDTIVPEKAVSKPLPSIKLVERAIAKVEPIAKAVEAEIPRITIRAEHLEIEAAEHAEPETDDIEDLAPFSMRFGAGLFDLIIGGFASMLLLSPMAFSGSNWMTPLGGLAFAGVWTLVMFLYMTACLGFYGKTFGMRLFSLELVDAVENQYPTLRQAAVNTALFLLTLPIAGVGFITCFFNEENRAVHDLLSGTILVREF